MENKISCFCSKREWERRKIKEKEREESYEKVLRKNRFWYTHSFSCYLLVSTLDSGDKVEGKKKDEKREKEGREGWNRKKREEKRRRRKEEERKRE